jgi:FkbM family methyltransferase
MSNNESEYFSNLTRNDMFIHHIFGEDYIGYFVEAGATDGIQNSCTKFLESVLGWKGVLVEPTSKFIDCQKNRPLSHCFNCCLGKNNQNIEFVEFEDHELSCPTQYVDRQQSIFGKDHLSPAKQKRFFIEQKTLKSIFEEVEAPRVIDYLALDVEGSELDVLLGIDFGQRQINIISTEGNLCYELLLDLGYKQVTNPFDKSHERNGHAWDYWWVHSDFFHARKQWWEKQFVVDKK